MMTMMAMTPTPQILTAGVHSPCQHGRAACHCPGRQVRLSNLTSYQLEYMQKSRFGNLDSNSIIAS